MQLNVKANAQEIAIQKFQLQEGWNLITFQVLPADTAPPSVFSQILSKSGLPLFDMGNPNASRLRAVFAGVPNGNSVRWNRFAIDSSIDISGIPRFVGAPNYQDGTQITSIEKGVGYFIYVDSIPVDSEFELKGEGIGTNSKLSLVSGWNLVGVPTDLTFSQANDIVITTLFRAGDLSKIASIHRWNARRRQHEVNIPSDSESSRFHDLNFSAAYWIKCSASLDLEPGLTLEAFGDIDNLPLQTNPVATPGLPWNPGPEDVDIGFPGTSPVFDSALTQSVVVVPKSASSIALPLYNRGGGVLSWSAKLLPSIATPSPGIYPLLSQPDVDLVLALKQATGVTTSTPGAITLEVDRTHLPPGVYLARLAVENNASPTRHFDIVIEVGGLDGEWVGRATIDTVGGKRNRVPDIDIHLHLFQDGLEGSRQIRGFIDSQETLLWPLDAPVLGHIADVLPSSAVSRDFSSKFVISGGYVMPPGDENRFPFHEFPIDPDVPGNQLSRDASTGLEFVTNVNGDRFYRTLRAPRSPSFVNPLNRFVWREFELSGELTDSNEGNSEASGSYTEVITGLLDTPILMKGTFRIKRTSHAPFRRRPIKRLATTPNGGIRKGAGDAYSTSVEVDEHIMIDRAVVVVSQTCPSSDYQLTLTSPSGTTIRLHNEENIGSSNGVIYDSGSRPMDHIGLLDPPELRGAKPLPSAGSTGLDSQLYERQLRESLAGYAVRVPRETLDALRDQDGRGVWSLNWVHSDTGRTHRFEGWSLLLYGVPAHTLKGRVIVDGSSDADRFSDVTVRLAGLNATLGPQLQSFDRSTGEFTFRFVPGLRVNVFATKPGWKSAGIDGLTSTSHPRGYRDHLDGFMAGGPGSEQLTITLTQSVTQRVATKRGDMYAFVQDEDTVVIRNLETVFCGRSNVSDESIHWQIDWDGSTEPDVPIEELPRGRSFSGDFVLPKSRFTQENNFSISIRPRAFLGSQSEYVADNSSIAVYLVQDQQPTLKIAQGTWVLGAGALSAIVGQDPTGASSLHGQKTQMAKVDIDRAPFIKPASNPSLSFALDGLDLHGEGEDIDTHPRTFIIHNAGTNGNVYAYAEIQLQSDMLFKALVPPMSGETPPYDDLTNGIDGRDIYRPNEPLRVFSAIGSQVVNIGVSGTNGPLRISAGVNPGPFPEPNNDE